MLSSQLAVIQLFWEREGADAIESLCRFILVQEQVKNPVVGTQRIRILIFYRLLALCIIIILPGLMPVPWSLPCSDQRCHKDLVAHEAFFLGIILSVHLLHVSNPTLSLVRPQPSI